MVLPIVCSQRFRATMCLLGTSVGRTFCGFHGLDHHTDLKTYTVRMAHIQHCVWRYGLIMFTECKISLRDLQSLRHKPASEALISCSICSGMSAFCTLSSSVRYVMHCWCCARYEVRGHMLFVYSVEEATVGTYHCVMVTHDNRLVTGDAKLGLFCSTSLLWEIIPLGAPPPGDDSSVDHVSNVCP